MAAHSRALIYKRITIILMRLLKKIINYMRITLWGNVCICNLKPRLQLLVACAHTYFTSNNSALNYFLLSEQIKMKHDRNTHTN